MWKRISILAIAFGLAASAHGSEKSICGTDDRVPSTNPKVARALKIGDPAGCTVTMIGRTCAISAGHCMPTFEVAEFNTPESRDGRIQHPAPEDVYEIIADSIVHRNGGQGNDYAVLRIRANNITGILPGDAQGFYEVSFDTPARGDMIRITGYGADSPDPDRNFAQQTHAGPIVSTTRSGILNHRADTMGGNSGSSVIHEETGKIIGIHTHGGCWSRGGSNASTLIAAKPELKEAINACLQWERDNL